MRSVYIDDEHNMEGFARRAAKHFAENEETRSFTDGDIERGCLFALRFGLGNDCVVVFEIGENIEPTNYQELVKEYT